MQSSAGASLANQCRSERPRSASAGSPRISSAGGLQEVMHPVRVDHEQRAVHVLEDLVVVGPEIAQAPWPRSRLAHPRPARARPCAAQRLEPALALHPGLEVDDHELDALLAAARQRALGSRSHAHDVQRAPPREPACGAKRRGWAVPVARAAASAGRACGFGTQQALPTGAPGSPAAFRIRRLWGVAHSTPSRATGLHPRAALARASTSFR